MNLCRRFLKDESGAVTIDWVVLTSGVVVLGLIVTAFLGQPLLDLITAIRDEMLQYMVFLQNP